MTNDEVAEVLEEIGILLELKGENPFKTRAYFNGARTISGLDETVKTLCSSGQLGSVKGIGAALQKKIEELVETGGLAYYEELKASIPEGLIEMLDIPGLGAKKVRAIHEALGVDTVDALEMACRSEKVAGLSGFGKKSEQKILDGIEFRKKYASQHLYSVAWAAAGPILDDLRSHPEVIRCDFAGSLRRHKEVIGDIDFLVSSNKAVDVIEDFVLREGVVDVLVKGETKTSVILEGGLQADLRVVSDAEYPFALAYFTGSKEHNVVMRQRAIQRGLRLNEYGLFRSKEETRNPELRVTCSTEAEIFKALGLDYVPPELREDRGEFEMAEQGRIPRLIEWTELKGSLHNHSTWSDGRATLDEIASYMSDLGCAYWAITDHSKSSFQANGLDVNRLRKQIEEVKAVNTRLEGEGESFRLLTGTEVDILNGGKLDFEDALLEELDVVVASIHQGFTQSESEMTQRLIAAVENPNVHMLGHLTGRLLLSREPYAVNQKAVIDACAETGTWIELNASPMRFDMDWRLWPYAKEKGVRCVINCDAHRLEQAGYLRLGAGIARKAGMQKGDVINTQDLETLRQSLAAKRSRSH